MIERQCCGQMSHGISCDRWPYHKGNHRGYREGVDAPVFWASEPASKPPTPALDELTQLHAEIQREFHHNAVDLPVSVNLDDWIARLATIIAALRITP